MHIMEIYVMKLMKLKSLQMKLKIYQSNTIRKLQKRRTDNKLIKWYKNKNTQEYILKKKDTKNQKQKENIN